MLILKELFDLLAYGELSGLKVGNSTLGSIVEADYPKIASHIWLALTDLHKRFPLCEKKLKLHQRAGITTYYLRSMFAGTIDYINDDIYIEYPANTPFLDDILKISAVKNASDVELILNDSMQENPVYTPSFDTLELTPSIPPEILTVIYRANHPKIVFNSSFNANKVYIQVSDVLIEPILLYVVMRIMRGMHTSVAEGQQNPASTFMYQYELACKKIVDFNLLIEDNTPSDKFTRNGFA